MIENIETVHPNTILSQTDMAKLLGVSPRTLNRWDKDKSFVARRKPNGQPYYLREDYYTFHRESLRRGEEYNV